MKEDLKIKTKEGRQLTKKEVDELRKKASKFMQAGQFVKK